MFLARSQLSRLVVKHLHILQEFPSKLDKVLVCRILVNVVVSICFAFEFYYKSMGVRALSTR